LFSDPFEYVHLDPNSTKLRKEHRNVCSVLVRVGQGVEHPIRESDFEAEPRYEKPLRRGSDGV
jgi:hypothetical protein